MEISFDLPPVLGQFIRSRARRRIIMGPFGSGKSSTCVHEVVRIAAQQAKGPDGFRRTRIAVVRNTVPQLRDTTMKTWFDWYPNGSIGYYKAMEKTFFIESGDIRCEVIFRGLDDANDVKNLLSLELTAVWLNEAREINKDIVEALDGRINRYPSVRNGGATWCGIFADTNPPDLFSYWYNVIEGLNLEDGEIDSDNGWEGFVQPPALLKDGTINPLAENLKHLAPQYYEVLMKGKTKQYMDVYLRNLYGSGNAGKPVHTLFDREYHVAKEPLIPNSKLPLLIAADFGLTPAMVLKQQDAHGRVLTYAEIATKDMGLDRCIKLKLKPLLNNRFPRYNVLITGDPSGGIRAQTDEKTCIDIFINNGFKRNTIKLATTNTTVARHGATDNFIGRRSDVGSCYLIDPSCHNLIRALSSGFRWKTKKDGDQADEVVKDFWSHIAEANQYGDLYFEGGVVTQDDQTRKRMMQQQLAREGQRCYTRR